MPDQPQPEKEKPVIDLDVVYWIVGTLVAAVFYIVAFQTKRMEAPRGWQETFVDVLFFPVVALLWPVIAVGMFGLLLWKLMF